MGNNTSTSSTQNNQKEHFQVPKSQQKENIDKVRSEKFLKDIPIREKIFLKQGKQVWFYNEDYSQFDVAYIKSWDEDYIVTLAKPNSNTEWHVPLWKLFLRNPSKNNDAAWNERMRNYNMEQSQLKF